MTTYVGGTRLRLITDNFYELVRSSLASLHWLDSGRQHTPITITREVIGWDDPVEFNTVAVGIMNGSDVDAELGSNMTQDTWPMFIDFYAENDSIGAHVAGDIRDALRGKIPSIGRQVMFMPVYDFTQGTDPDTDTSDVLFDVEIANVKLDRAYNQARSWMKHWFSVSCDLIDFYGDEHDS